MAKRDGGAAPAVQQAPPPGALFGLPGFTQRIEQWEPWEDVTTVLSQNAQTTVVSGPNLQQTDVVFWWELELTWTNTLTVGGGAASTSPYFPYNIVQALELPMQGQYRPIDVESGIDAAIFESYRPMRKTNQRNNLYANPAATWATTSLAQSNLNAATGLTATSTPITLKFDIPGSIYFDAYYELALDGTLLSPIPVAAHISPQYMGGSERKVRPKVTFAAGLVDDLDAGPFLVTGGAPTYAGQMVSSIRRVGVIGSNNPAEMPIVRNWQYTRKTHRIGMGAQTKLPIPLAGEEYGQILSVFVRGWDPEANSGKGAPININTIDRCQVLYGSNVARFDDHPKQAQRRFFDQHGFLPPVGVLVWDMAIRNDGALSNAGALNTLNTSNLQVMLDFNTAPSASAYYVVGIEALEFVSVQ